jgi:hypothetical protein
MFSEVRQGSDFIHAMRNLKVKADIPKNRLYFTFAGIATKKTMEGLYTDVRFCVADLKPGFDVISDFSDCELIHLNSIPALKKIMSYLIENQLGQIVRILQSDKVSHKQVLNLATRVQGYSPIYVSSADEADEKLKNAIKRKGLRFHLHNLPVKYIVNNEEGKGKIINMSTSDCAVEFTTFGPKKESAILLDMIFEKDDKPPNLFTIKAKVTRIDHNVFAAEFTDFDNESKELLWRCLIDESRR